MKNLSISVEFKDPIKEIRSQLERSGARNINIRKNYSGELEISYSLKSSDPEKEITNMLTSAGANSVRSSSNYNGARFDFRIDDIIDDRKFKQMLIEALRKAGMRAN